MGATFLWDIDDIDIAFISLYAVVVAMSIITIVLHFSRNSYCYYEYITTIVALIYED